MGRYNTIKNISRLMAVLLALTMLLCLSPAVYADGESGSCGDNLTWSLSAGTLTITGSGAMSNYSEYAMAPWYDLRGEVIRLVLPEGLTAIGDMAFYGFDKLTAVAVPDSVTRIGRYAFAGCTGMEMLSLGGVRSVGEYAFSDCIRIRNLRLPNSLESIGNRGFYRCESVTTVTIPASVTSLGVSAFGYCTALVNAEIYATIDKIPDLLFYGCRSLIAVTIGGTAEDIGEYAFRGCKTLSTIYHDGSNMTSEEIQDLVLSGADDEGYVHVSEGGVSDTVTSGSTQENEDGTVTQDNTSVSENENTTVSTTISTTFDTESGEDTESSAEVIITVEDEEAWEEVLDAVNDAMDAYSEVISNNGTDAQQVQVQIYVKGSDYIDPDFVNAMAGRNVLVTVMTGNGSMWKFNGLDLGAAGSGAVTLTYELTAGSPELSAELGVENSFVLRFLNPAQVNAEVLIRLGGTYAYQNATLFQRDQELKQLQSAVVDADGYAHLYLGSVNDETEYYIAVNLAGASEEAQVPDELLNSYGNPIRTEPLKYEITGRTSSWGMTINQVTWIMAGVLVFCVVTVGVVMYALNKRKLKMGYIPDLDDDE